jgi:hypothetical protein
MPMQSTTINERRGPTRPFKARPLDAVLPWFEVPLPVKRVRAAHAAVFALELETLSVRWDDAAAAEANERLREASIALELASAWITTAEQRRRKHAAAYHRDCRCRVDV